MSTTGDVRTRLARADPLAAVSCLVALVVYLLHGFEGRLTADLGVYAYGGQQVAEGVPPYVAILNRAGPLAHLLPGSAAVVARAVGADDVIAMRVLYMVISVAGIGLAYLLGRDLFRSRLSGVATAAALLCVEGWIDLATYGPREKTVMVVLLLAALLAVVHQRWATTGVLVSLATLTWQPVFFVAMAAVLLAVLLGGERRLRALLRVAVGGVVPAAIAVLAYVVLGALEEFLDAFLLINARYTRQHRFFDFPAENARDLVHGYGSSLVVLGVGAVVLLVLAVAALVRPDPGHRAERAALVGIAASLLVGLAWSARAFDSWPDALVLLPCAVLGVGGLVGTVERWLPAKAAVALTTAWAVGATAIALNYSVGSRNENLELQREAVETVLATLPADAEVISISAPQPLVLGQLRHPSRLQVFGNGLILYVDDAWPGGREGYAQWISDRSPEVIALGPDDAPDWLVPVLDEDYARVGRTTGWAWFVHRDVGADTLAALRHDLRDLRAMAR